MMLYDEMDKVNASCLRAIVLGELYFHDPTNAAYIIGPLLSGARGSGLCDGGFPRAGRAGWISTRCGEARFVLGVASRPVKMVRSLGLPSFDTTIHETFGWHQLPWNASSPALASCCLLYIQDISIALPTHLTSLRSSIPFPSTVNETPASPLLY